MRMYCKCKPIHNSVACICANVGLSRVVKWEARVDTPGCTVWRPPNHTWWKNVLFSHMAQFARDMCLRMSATYVYACFSWHYSSRYIPHPYIPLLYTFQSSYHVSAKERRVPVHFPCTKLLFFRAKNKAHATMNVCVFIFKLGVKQTAVPPSLS